MLHSIPISVIFEQPKSVILPPRTAVVVVIEVLVGVSIPGPEFTPLPVAAQFSGLDIPPPSTTILPSYDCTNDGSNFT
ncbi:MAG: hypothetical protein C0596_10460 [Marinilabiliales bacterium]|nr:MAG: hypothetical protein C0596_10460 [Marinilabiliales bacterium]